MKYYLRILFIVQLLFNFNNAFGQDSSLPTGIYQKSGEVNYFGGYVKSVDGKVTIIDIYTESPAEKAGLKINDIIKYFGKFELKSNQDLQEAIDFYLSHEDVDLIIRRGKGIFNTSLKMTKIKTFIKVKSETAI